MKVRFKEKVFVGDDEQDDWETLNGWAEDIEAQTIEEAIRIGDELCRNYENKAEELGDKIQVSCEVEV